ncbi:glycosyltransferase family 2 protein [Priestia aryabhattai]|nr:MULTISPECIES: glycosyltransferase family 2 protein [Priestia]MED3820745.1 glycosyltransferase family 2 protein [Priestia aryabhattai]QSF33259.1 glycosyltransferase family 2 protein [Priestia megaterium]
MKNFISIIVPVYNGEANILKCVNSLLKQTYKNFEIILVNDGSNDRTLEILTPLVLEHSSLKLINKKNEGVSIARNVGLENASGQYITFMDSDDWVQGTYLEKVAETIEKYQSDCIYFNYYEEYNNSKSILVEDFKKVENYSKEKIRTKLIPLFIGGKEGLLMGSVWRGIYKSSILKEKVKFKKNINYMEDLIFNIAILKYAEKVTVSNIAPYYYFINESSVTGKYLDNMHSVSNQVLQELTSEINSSCLNEYVKENLVYRKNLITIDCIKNEFKNENIKLRNANLKNLLREEKILKMEKTPLRWLPYIVGIKMKSVPILNLSHNFIKFLKLISS